MNVARCANCLLHGWKQEENPNSLQQCSKCKLIQYCGKDCQAEHWQRVHKKQCKYFADPVKAQKWGHSEDDCARCLKAIEVGQTELSRSSNPNYECILKETFPSHLYHPHPFPVTGEPGYTSEKAVIVLWQLLKKLELIQPKYRGKLSKVFAELKMTRLNMWNSRKIRGKSEWRLIFNPPSVNDVLISIEQEFGYNDSLKDLFLTIELINGISRDVYICENLLILHNPFADIPPDLRMMVSQALRNITNFLTVANQVLEALTTQLVPYQDLVRIICGDSLEKRCHFCPENTIIDKVGRICGGRGSGTAFFNCLVMEIYRCGADTSYENAFSMMMQDYSPLFSAVMTALVGRDNAQMQCDFCLKLAPSREGHRCNRCLSVIYCNTNCQDQDWQIRKNFCKEDVEERKKKYGSSIRRRGQGRFRLFGETIRKL